MEKFEALWKHKKSDLAYAIIKSEDKDDIYSLAKELAEMELDEIEYDAQETEQTGKVLAVLQPEINVCNDCPYCKKL